MVIVRLPRKLPQTSGVNFGRQADKADSERDAER
jgi:hypothetical protein